MTIRRGFTIVEIMVVMAIIAVLTLLGVSAIIGINSNNVVDRATEEIITAVRESQNSAISIASNPVSGLTPPLAWGVYIDATNKSVQPFYLGADETYVPHGELLNYGNLEKLEISVGNSYHLFTTPFGKYYSTNNSPSGWVWNPNPKRPYDIIPNGVTSTKSVIKISFRNSEKTIVIGPNGDVYAE